MNRAAALAAVLAAAATGATAQAAPAKPRPIASYCSGTGDICFGVLDRSGAVYFELTTFARYFSRHRLCVRPPRGAETCRTFAVTRRGAYWGSSVRWHRTFPAAGSGVYRVTWRLGSNPLGPTLRFRLPLR